MILIILSSQTFFDTQSLDKRKGGGGWRGGYEHNNSQLPLLITQLINIRGAGCPSMPLLNMFCETIGICFHCAYWILWNANFLVLSKPLVMSRWASSEGLVNYFISWCWEPSQPVGIISGLKETFIKRSIVERTNKAELRPQEHRKKTESCRENLWNEIQLKGPIRPR